MLPTCTEDSWIKMADANGNMQIIPQEEVDEILQDGRTLIDTLLNQPETEMQSIVNGLQLKISVGKSY